MKITKKQLASDILKYRKYLNELKFQYQYGIYSDIWYNDHCKLYNDIIKQKKELLKQLF